MGQNLRGFDISDNQGAISPGGWQQAKADGYVFAVAKATEGLTFTDGQFIANVQNAKAAGFVVAAYHFAHATDDGGGQAQFFLSTIAPVASLLGGQLASGIVLPHAVMDLEQVSPDWSSLDMTTRVARVGHFLDAVDANFGERTMLYTAPGWFNDVFPNVDFSGHPLWTASPDSSKPVLCGAWTTAFCWQYSWSGTVPGIGSAIDLDVIYDPN